MKYTIKEVKATLPPMIYATCIGTNLPKAMLGSPNIYVTVTDIINDAGKALISEPHLYLPSLMR